ncbi:MULTISPECIES: hypothetical protein [Achromobacter]|uniref:Uncharacterized protein n=1 Tax=Achromobacter aegrifaciens TaxID=1287736 RepID=A0AAD2J4M8_ACHAE|nr:MULTISPECIES: hypothetical protein [Achromobacter]CAB3921230.1 hypothetical protein LMG26684_05721 [Achromobacter mucicolens]CUJ70257.1 Uncharacterised protein [Achromobacter aegrifaciens]
MNDCLTSHELFGELFTARCSCRSECCKGNCSEMAWLGRAQRFVQSYLPALEEARNAAPNSVAWWSHAAKRNPVPTMPEYFELLEHTAGVSVSAREKMTQYLERELPGYAKALGRHQSACCSDHFQYCATLAANPPTPGTCLYTSTEVARQLLPTAGAWTQSNVACALEELTEWYVKNHGLAAPIDCAAVRREVQEMNMASGSRDQILEHLEPLVFECQWMFLTFGPERAGFNLRIIKSQP